MDKTNVIEKIRVATELLLFPKERGKYEQNPKIISFQIKTNKMLEITGKGGGYTYGKY